MRRSVWMNLNYFTHIHCEKEKKRIRQSRGQERAKDGEHVKMNNNNKVFM